MTRLEVLELVYRNAPNRDNAKHYSVIKSAIGEDFYKELDKMGFLNSEYVVGERYVWLSYLGKAYCKEIFKQK